jgi:3D (Asp-Asp-Asp) domain-containing protein
LDLFAGGDREPVRVGVSLVALGGVAMNYLWLLLLLGNTCVPTPGRLTYYGVGDGLLGKRHAASWRGVTPQGWPEVITLEHRGIASGDRNVPIGTRVMVTYDGKSSEAVVMDYMARDTPGRWDAWPKTFKDLAQLEVGVLDVTVTRLDCQ